MAKFAEFTFSVLGRTTVPHPPRLSHIGQTVNATGFAYATCCCALQSLEQFSKRMVPLVERRRVLSLLY